MWTSRLGGTQQSVSEWKPPLLGPGSAGTGKSLTSGSSGHQATQTGPNRDVVFWLQKSPWHGHIDANDHPRETCPAFAAQSTCTPKRDTIPLASLSMIVG